MKRVALISIIGTIIAVLLLQLFKWDFMLSIAITLGTTAYHFTMRLLVGLCVDGIMKNRANCDAWWFRQRPFEEKIYRKLKVAAWKKHMPSYQPELFSMKDRSLNEIAQAMCQAEIVHEIIIVFSFLPLCAVSAFGSFWVFLITSLLAAYFDMIFVIMQRFNRPRILKISRRFG